MRAEVVLGEDTSHLFLRWEIAPDGKERSMLEELGGPLTLRIHAEHYVDEGGKYYESIPIDVPIFPHPGTRNRGQAKFRDHEARRQFLQHLQTGVTGDIADFIWDSEPGSVDVEGHVLERGTPPENKDSENDDAGTEEATKEVKA